ncbi:MAG: DUF4190 domain-containing protein [Chloroflexota bacterium]
MENSIKTNRLAIVSFVSGLIALLSLGFYWVLFLIAFPSSPGYAPESANRAIITIMDLSISVRNLCALVALLIGILALRDIKKKDGTEKGKILAWVGIILGAGEVLFRLLVGIIFILAKILH